MEIPNMTKLYKCLIAVFGLLFMPSYASAHLVTTGLGPVYDGIGHLVMTPEDLVPVQAIALFAGLRGAAPGRRALFVLPLAWFAGGLLGGIRQRPADIAGCGYIVSYSGCARRGRP
jgi:hypothetical protein